MRKYFLALAVTFTTLAPANALETSPIKVQQWHTGVWVSWDRPAVKSVMITMAEEENVGMSGGTMSRVVTDDFTYVPFNRGFVKPPVKKTFLVSVVELDMQLDGVAGVPECVAFATSARFIASIPSGAVFNQVNGCGNETLYRVTVNIPDSKPGKVVANPEIYVGARLVNKKAIPTSCLNCDPRRGDVTQADIAAGDKAKAVLFVDSLFTGLPKNAAVRVDGYWKDNGKYQWRALNGVAGTGGTNTLMAVAQPAWTAFTDTYRVSVWDPSKKKVVYTSKALDVGLITSVPTQASGKALLPLSYLPQKVAG